MIISKVQLIMVIAILAIILVVGVGYVGYMVSDLRDSVIVCGDLDAWLVKENAVNLN